MGLTVTTPPAAEPLTTAEAKLHLRVDHSEEDALIDRLVSAARRACELYRRETFVTTVWGWTLDRFPRAGDRYVCNLVVPSFDRNVMVVPRPPLVSVGSITYVDADGDSTVLSSSLYQVDAASRPGRIAPAYGQVWPATRGVMNAVTVAFTAGYGAASAVPENFKAAILLMVGHLFRNREAVNVGNIVSELPMAARFLLDVDRIPQVA